MLKVDPSNQNPVDYYASVLTELAKEIWARGETAYVGMCGCAKSQRVFAIRMSNYEFDVCAECGRRYQLQKIEPWRKVIEWIETGLPYTGPTESGTQNVPPQ